MSREDNMPQDFRSERPAGDGPVNIQEDAARLKDEAIRQGAAAVEQVKEGVQSAAESAKEQVSQYAAEAKEQVSRYADDQKQAVTQHLDDFAKAVREASDTLSKNDQTMASQVVRQAASGLESLSRSVSGANLQDLVNSVRDFGRANPIAFIGGAMLAGLALGRFARASGSTRSSQGDESDWRSRSGSTSERGSDWDRWSEGRGGGYERSQSRSYSGSGYSAGERSSFASPNRSMGDFPSPSQSFAGGGTGTDPMRPSRPSSAADVSDATSAPAGNSFSSGSISTGGGT
jgi:hypothetical protein